MTNADTRPVLSAKARLLAHESEADFQAAIVAAAEANGWLAYHTYDARKSEPGFPDLILVRGPVLLALEVKRQSGSTTPAQERWLDAFGAVEHVTSAVVRPSDWDALVLRLSAPLTGVGRVSS